MSTTRRRFREFFSLVFMVTLLLVTRASFADHYFVPSGSMEPTVLVGDHVLVDKAAYAVRLPLTHMHLVDRPGPARGDVVVLTSPETSEVLLKRVVALAGDTVSVRDGHVTINGHLAPISLWGDAPIETLDRKSHTLGLAQGGGPDFGPAVVPPHRLLVMGDNRGNSHDGRDFGFVDQEALLGRAMGVFLRDGVPRWSSL